jgi:predicted NBD/HSP70 family sugar kinase
MSTLGLDIGGSSVKAALLDGSAAVHLGQSRPYVQPGPAELVTAIRQAVGGRAAGAEAIGVCVPGLLYAEGKTVTAAVNVPGLVDVPLDALLSEALGLARRPLHVFGDARAAAYDIFRSRRLAGRMLVLSLGTGVGAAVLDDGVALRVDGDSSGHIGQIDVSLTDFPVKGPDGGSGGLEGYLGAGAIAARHGMDAAQAAGRFKGDEPAVRALVRAIRICHAIYRPHHVCLTGGVGICMGHLLVRIRTAVETGLTGIARSVWTLSTGNDEYHAARGTARLAGEA